TFPDRAAVCNTILPFTRNVVGSMDYTPTTFSQHLYPHTTSFGHELALSVVFESGVQHMADDYKMYEKQPAYVVDFMKSLPTVWDDTVLLDGYPGEQAIMARRHGNHWFVAGIVAHKTATTYVLKFPFLTERLETLTLITDQGGGEAFKK